MSSGEAPAAAASSEGSPASPERDSTASYPVNLRLGGRPVLVVGGGAVALEKILGLLDGGADDITVVAPEVRPEIGELPVTVERRRYEDGEAARYRLVVSAIDDPEVSQQISDEADAAGVWVNVADDPDRCTVTLPARVRRGDLLLTVSTAGRSPALSTWLRKRLETEFGPEYETLVEVVGAVRGRLRAEGRQVGASAWQTGLDSGKLLDLIRSGRSAEAEGLLWSCLSSSSE